MRIIFLGTPDFAVPVLEALYSAGHEIAAVISQPDREKDKKGNILPTPVKSRATALGLHVLQYDKISEHVAEIAELNPELMITAAYGQILSKAVLKVPRYGTLNVHGSLLPAYRGSSPVQSALLAGDTRTGVTIMKTDVGMDTGDILADREIVIDENDTAKSLLDKVSFAGAKLLVETIPSYINGEIKPLCQDALGEPTYCKKISKADGLIDWSKSAREIRCAVRAYNPWPSAYTYLDGVQLKIHAAKPCDKQNNCAVGTVSVVGDSAYVKCGEGSLEIVELQLAGRKAMPVSAFIRGYKNLDGKLLGNE